MRAAASPFEGVAFRVNGIPAPQGSKRHVGNGRLIESSRKVAPWRALVAAGAVDAMNGHPPYDEPVQVEVTFRLARPKSAPNRAHPHTRPDLDKLTRSTGDALQTGGVYTEDSRVIRWLVSKVYDDVPGADITVRTIE